MMGGSVGGMMSFASELNCGGDAEIQIQRACSGH